MSRFKIKFKLQGLELDIEGDRKDVGLISRAVGDQVASLIAPAGQIVEGEGASGNSGMIDVTPTPAKERKATRRKAPGTAQAPSAAAIDFRHDPERFGTPAQGWTTLQKSLWLIFVVGEVSNSKQLSTGSLTATFNKHFRQAGVLNRSNVGRDLGRVKAKAGERLALVGEDTTKAPPEWFLTDEGRKIVHTLIAQSRGETGQA